jgi:hypothetical protein
VDSGPASPTAITGSSTRPRSFTTWSGAKGPEVEPDMKAPWLTAAGFPERVALIHMFTSPLEKAGGTTTSMSPPRASPSSTSASPPKARFGGTSRVWLTKTVNSSAAEIECWLGNPEGVPHTHRQLSQRSRDGTMHNELSVHPDIQDHGWRRRSGT